MWVAHDFAYSLLAGVFEGLARLAPRFLQGRRRGDVASAVMSDVEVTERFFAHTVADHVVAGVVTVGAVVALGVLNAEVVDGVQGMRELVAFGQGRSYHRRLMDRTRSLQRQQLRYGQRAGAEAAATDLLLAVGLLTVLVLAAALVGAGSLALALFPVAVLLGAAAFVPLAEVTQTARELGQIRACARRVFHIIDHPEAVTDTTTPHRIRSDGTSSCVTCTSATTPAGRRRWPG